MPLGPSFFFFLPAGMRFVRFSLRHRIVAACRHAVPGLLFIPVVLLAGCSSDPATFTTYSHLKGASTGTYDATRDAKPTDALALNYANSVEEIFRARATGSRYTREASDTALAGLSAFAGASETLSIGATALSGMGLAGVGILELRKIFDARGRSTAYGEAAERIHGAIKDFRSYNLNDVSESELSPNGWTLANIVQSNIDIVGKILNGRLPSADALTQASERMTKEGAVAQRAGPEPHNNLPTTPLRPPAPPAGSQGGAGTEAVVQARIAAAMATRSQRAISASEAEIDQLKKEIKRLQGQHQSSATFTELVTQILVACRDDVPKQTAAYQAILDDPVVRASHVPSSVSPPDLNGLNRYFQGSATASQKDALIQAAQAQVDHLSTH